jgi:hypothetical protein
MNTLYGKGTAKGPNAKLTMLDGLQYLCQTFVCFVMREDIALFHWARD